MSESKWRDCPELADKLTEYKDLMWQYHSDAPKDVDSSDAFVLELMDAFEALMPWRSPNPETEAMKEYSHEHEQHEVELAQATLNDFFNRKKGN